MSYLGFALIIFQTRWKGKDVVCILEFRGIEMLVNQHDYIGLCLHLQVIFHYWVINTGQLYSRVYSMLVEDAFKLYLGIKSKVKFNRLEN